MFFPFVFFFVCGNHRPSLLFDKTIFSWNQFPFSASFSGNWLKCRCSWNIMENYWTTSTSAALSLSSLVSSLSFPLLLSSSLSPRFVCEVVLLRDVPVMWLILSVLYLLSPFLAFPFPFRHAHDPPSLPLISSLDILQEMKEKQLEDAQGMRLMR